MRKLMLFLFLSLFISAYSQTYQKVTTAPTDWSGKYLIVYENSETEAFVFNGTSEENNSIIVITTGGTIKGDYSACELTFSAKSDGTYYIKNKNDYYVGAKSSGNLISVSSEVKNNSINMNGDFVDIKSSESDKSLKFYTEKNLFGFYPDNETRAKSIYLYKLTEEPYFKITGNSELITTLNGSVTQTISVTAVNVTDNINITIKDELNLFSVSSSILTNTGGNITITYNGTISGVHNATLELFTNDTTEEIPISAYTTHTGTEDDPMTVTDVVKLNNTYLEKCWVRGTITGTYDLRYPDTGYYEGLIPEGTALQSTYQHRNIALSDENNNIMVFLMPKSTARTELNLNDNPEKLNSNICIYGTLGDYQNLGFVGITDASEYKDDTATLINNTLIDENVPVEYYNLQGVKVANPEKGIFIKKQGVKTTKVVL